MKGFSRRRSLVRYPGRSRNGTYKVLVAKKKKKKARDPLRTRKWDKKSLMEKNWQ